MADVRRDGFGTIFATGATPTDPTGGAYGGGGGGGGVELLTATPGSSTGAPVGDLNLGVQVSVLINQTGAAAYWHLPDGTEGQIKEIVNGAPGSLQSNAFIGVTCSNGWGNDLIDLSPYNSIRLVWCTAASGWVAVSVCNIVNNFWD